MNENQQINLSNALETFVSSVADLRKYWDDYLIDEYNNGEYEREYFADLAKIAGYIVEKWKRKETDDFEELFAALEEIFTKCHPTTCSIISAGLLEHIQAHKDIDYYFGFNKWLKPKTQEWWDVGIDYWEGADWKKKNIS